MNERSTEQSNATLIKLGPEKLRLFFVSHLNRIYCAKQHLAKQLPGIHQQSHFADLKNAISETLDDVDRQVIRMDEIYTLLDTTPTGDNCDGLMEMMDGVYTAIQAAGHDTALRDLSILFYMQIIESVEMASFQMLQMAAVKLKNKAVQQLLLENYDEAKGDRVLLLLIAAKYITS